MAICPFAVWKPLPANAKQPRIVPRAFIIHAPVDGDSTTSLFEWFRSQGNETHFYITRTGGLEQYMDTEVRADAQHAANSFGVSVEVWDGRASHPKEPTQPMSALQMTTLIALAEWVCKTHAIPRHVCTAPNAGGIGWHELFPSWNRNGHDCPGPAREQQITSVLIPALNATAVPPYMERSEMALAVTHLDGHHEFFDVFGGALVHDWQVGASSATWSGWQTLSTDFEYVELTGVTLEPAGSPSAGNVNVFARTKANGIVGWWFDGTGWHGAVPCG